MPWTWRLESDNGTVLEEPATPSHPNQSDAESWLGENWRELADAGVAATTLLEDDRVVYGPMPLDAG